MSNPVFAATYSDWRLVRSRGVVQVVFELPLEKSDVAYQVLGGMPKPGQEKWFAVAALNAEPKAIPGTPDHKLTQQAAIACNDIRFQRFLYESELLKEMNSDLAAKAVRLFCGVSSRADIKPGEPSASKWLKLYEDYLLWKNKDKYVNSVA